jgi:hypothetical protein
MFELIMRLEKRVIALEMLAGIVPAKEDLTHPKAYVQAEARVEQARLEAEKEAE